MINEDHITCCPTYVIASYNQHYFQMHDLSRFRFSFPGIFFLKQLNSELDTKMSRNSISIVDKHFLYFQKQIYLHISKFVFRISFFVFGCHRVGIQICLCGHGRCVDIFPVLQAGYTPLVLGTEVWVPQVDDED